MRIATAAYPLDVFPSWEAYAEKQDRWIADAAGQGAELLVFPEYGRIELATLDGSDAAGDLERSLHAAARWTERADVFLTDRAHAHGVTILAASGPVFDGPGRPVNRAVLIGPEGVIGWQDKQIMTRFERETWDIRSGGPLRVFDIGGVRVGILICYDAEFPLLGRSLAEAGTELFLVPSCTDALSGYSRVRIGAMARALENQCVVIQSPTVGIADWSPAVDDNHGAAAIFGPPDLGFPPTGIIAEGELNAPGWIIADVDMAAIGAVRTSGAVFNHVHWPESHARARVSADRQDLP